MHLSRDPITLSNNSGRYLKCWAFYVTMAHHRGAILLQCHFVFIFFFLHIVADIPFAVHSGKKKKSISTWTSPPHSLPHPLEGAWHMAEAHWGVLSAPDRCIAKRQMLTSQDNGALWGALGIHEEAFCLQHGGPLSLLLAIHYRFLAWCRSGCSCQLRNELEAVTYSHILWIKYFIYMNKWFKNSLGHFNMQHISSNAMILHLPLEGVHFENLCCTAKGERDVIVIGAFLFLIDSSFCF